MRYTLGYLRIELRGTAVARFVQAAAHEGIEFWDLRYRGQAYEASLLARDFRRVRPLARRTHTRVRIVGRSGLPFRLRGPARQATLLGLVLFIGLIYLLGSFVWRIEITGIVGVSEDVVLCALDQSGLRVGQPRRWVDTRAVETELLTRMPGLSWVGIELHGMVAIVTVVEKSAREDLAAEMLPADVVAAKDGVIEMLVVLHGQARVDEGQRVQAGQVLIAGEGGGVSSGGARGPTPGAAAAGAGLRARGIVKARVTYELEAEAPLLRVIVRRTGEQQQRAVLRVGVRDIILSGPREVPFELYEESPDSLAWRGGTGEVLAELVSITYHELERIEEYLGPDGARLEAEAAAREELGRHLVPGAILLGQQVSERVANDSMVVRLIVEAIEDIGLTRIRGSPAP
ncbi:MAG: sporulation protein YqfD [Bacillota bacterium]|nr:sporulation protein YqfD [Bacillota bacterium]